jgi:hypothetical protein
MLAVARALGFPIDARGTVDTRRFTKPGLMRMRQRTALAKFDIHPEAIWLYLNRTRHSVTIETPSEFFPGDTCANAGAVDRGVRRAFVCYPTPLLLPLSRSHSEKLPEDLRKTKP